MPPSPDEIIKDLRGNFELYSDFVFHILRRVEGKRKFDNSARINGLADIVKRGKEAFVLLVYENGYERWNWLSSHGVRGVDLASSNDTTSSEGSDVQQPSYRYTKGNNASSITKRNAGWGRLGKVRFVELYDKVTVDRAATERQGFNEEFRAWLMMKTGMDGRPPKRQRTSSRSSMVEMPDDLGELQAV